MCDVSLFFYLGFVIAAMGEVPGSAGQVLGKEKVSPAMPVMAARNAVRANKVRETCHCPFLCATKSVQGLGCSVGV